MDKTVYDNGVISRVILTSWHCMSVLSQTIVITSPSVTLERLFEISGAAPLCSRNAVRHIIPDRCIVEHVLVVKYFYDMESIQSYHLCQNRSNIINGIPKSSQDRRPKPKTILHFSLHDSSHLDVIFIKPNKGCNTAREAPIHSAKYNYQRWYILS